MSMNIADIQNEIIEEFEMLGEDWAEKYKYIIELGQQAPKLSDDLKTEDRKIKGCQSQVWLHSRIENDHLIYEADSDALITKGLINLLIRVLSDHSPKEIVESELYFIDKIGMKNHLSPNRANGLAHMVKQMKLDALAFKTKLENAE